MPQPAAEKLGSAAPSLARECLAIGFCAFALIGGLACPLLPIMLAGKFCPATTFAGGTMESAHLITFASLLSIFCYFYLSVGLFPKRNGKARFKLKFMNELADNYWRLFVTITLGGIGVGTLVSFDAVQSYYCLMPAKILLHSSAFAKPRSLVWSDVMTVEAECPGAKGGPVGGLVLSFQNGAHIWVALGRGEPSYALEYLAIRKALVGRSYKYTADFSVTAGYCPQSVYPWLMSFQQT